MENQASTNTNQSQFLELKISNKDLTTLVENEIFHEFNHKIEIDDTSYSKVTIYYHHSQISRLVNFIREVNLFSRREQ
jgi:hypothetical protein